MVHFGWFLILTGFLLYPGPPAWAQSVIATINVGTDPIGVGVNATTNRTYVSNIISNNVSVINGDTNTVSATINVGTNPFGVGVNVTTNRSYVANFTSNNVSVINGDTNTVSATINVGTNPFVGVGVNATTNRIYVANRNTSNVSVIDGANNTVIATVGVGSLPQGVGVNETTNRIYVANSNSANVSVIQDTAPTIPTLPQWGMMLLTLSLLTLATWELAGRPFCGPRPRALRWLWHPPPNCSAPCLWDREWPQWGWCCMRGWWALWSLTMPWEGFWRVCF